MEAETTDKYKGIPLSEKEYEQWLKIFSDIEKISDSLTNKKSSRK